MSPTLFLSLLTPALAQTPVDPIPVLTIEGAAGAEGLGIDVAIVNDVNGDGYDELLLTGEGVVEVYYGSATGPAAVPDLTLWGGVIERFGRDIQGIGDVDGDGYGDVAIASHFDDDGAGRVDVFHGSAAGLAATPDLVLHGNAETLMGQSLATADIDDDGFSDLLIGAPETDDEAGAFRVHYGSAAGLSTMPDVEVFGLLPGVQLGWSIAGGDVNGDGFGDVVVGQPASGQGNGTAWVYWGSSTGLDTSSPLSIGPLLMAYDTRYGYAVAAVDLDDDGFDEVVVGSYDDTVLVWRGGTTLSPSPSTAT